MKNYYQLLEIPPAASAEEVKRAFRHQIARYHPDKVQHLGAEFQAMAADRAAELTEAYRILSDPARRDEYDRMFSPGAAAPPRPAPTRPADSVNEPPPAAPAVDEPEPPHGTAFSEERARGDAFVRRAVLSRFQTALEGAVPDSYDQPRVRGFDVAVVPRAKLFGRSGGPRLLVRVVPRVDRDAIADAWVAALKSQPQETEQVVVLLMGSGMAPARELADAISEQRRKSPRGSHVSLVPIDSRDWQAHVPHDAPAVVRTLLDRLRHSGR